MPRLVKGFGSFAAVGSRRSVRSWWTSPNWTRSPPILLPHHRSAAARSGRLPGPLQRLLSRAHRIRFPLLPFPVRRARPGPAGCAAPASGVVLPLDAGDSPVQALHRLPALLGRGRVSI